MFFFMDSVKIKAYERDEGEKENQTCIKPDIIIIHTPPKKKEKIKTHITAQHNIFFHHHSHPHTHPKAAEWLTRDVHASITFCFFMCQMKTSPLENI